MLRNVLCCSFLFALFVSGYGDQVVLQQQQDSILRRFSVESDYDVRRLLATAQEYNLDVWQTTNSHIDIYFPENTPVPGVINAPFTEWHIPSTPPTLNHLRSRPLWNLSSFSSSAFHDEYHSLAEIEEFMTELSTSFPELVQITPFGRTAEQREMLGMRISKTRSDKRRSTLKRKMGIVIIGAQHAREWISVSTALYLSHALVANSSEPFSILHLLDTYDFYILPVANPDGYRYTWDSDRFWYKNRQVLGPKEKCIGVDMNRNWGYKWKASVDSQLQPADPCHHWYPGTRPFQAPEVNNIANYIATLSKIEILLDLRSYGQMISTPLSHSCKRIPKDAEDQLEAALGAAHMIAKVHGTQYTTGRLCSTLYKAPGNIVDWMYKRNGIKHTYAVHLRDTGTYGFALPAEWIRPVGEESAKMVEYLAKFIVTIGP